MAKAKCLEQTFVRLEVDLNYMERRELMAYVQNTPNPDNEVITHLFEQIFNALKDCKL